jgi:hypothetical protein
MLLLSTMIWRACSRALNESAKAANLIGALGIVSLISFLIFNYKITSFLGAISFGISDYILCNDLFINKISNGNFIVMITYYFAQFGIAFSVLNNNKDKVK